MTSRASGNGASGLGTTAGAASGGGCPTSTGSERESATRHVRISLASAFEIPLAGISRILSIWRDHSDSVRYCADVIRSSV
jgi:hypothetical protein